MANGKLSLQFIVATILSWVRDFITAPECPDQIIPPFYLHLIFAILQFEISSLFQSGEKIKFKPTGYFFQFNFWNGVKIIQATADNSERTVYEKSPPQVFIRRTLCMTLSIMINDSRIPICQN